MVRRLIETVLAAGLLAALAGLAAPEEANAMLDGFGEVKLGQPLPAQVVVEAMPGDEVWRIEPGWVQRPEIQTYDGRDYSAFYRVQQNVVTEIYLRTSPEGDKAECGRVLDQLAKTYGPMDGAASVSTVSDFEAVRGATLTDAGRELFVNHLDSKKDRVAVKRAFDGRVLELMALSTPEGACFEFQISYRLE
jgi:hypothetical protein